MFGALKHYVFGFELNHVYKKKVDYIIISFFPSQQSSTHTETENEKHSTNHTNAISLHLTIQAKKSVINAHTKRFTKFTNGAKHATHFLVEEKKP